MDQDDDAPISFVYNGLRQLGGAAVPAQLLVLGASLAKGPQFTAGGATMKLHAAIAFTKLLLMPAVLLFIMFCLIKLTILSARSREAALVMMLVSCVPSANNLIIMLEVSGRNPNMVTTSIFIQYALAPAVLTGWLSVFPMLLVSSAFLGDPPL